MDEGWDEFNADARGGDYVCGSDTLVPGQAGAASSFIPERRKEPAALRAFIDFA
jgi:hypothetical protein